MSNREARLVRHHPHVWQELVVDLGTDPDKAMTMAIEQLNGDTEGWEWQMSPEALQYIKDCRKWTKPDAV